MSSTHVLVCVRACVHAVRLSVCVCVCVCLYLHAQRQMEACRCPVLASSTYSFEIGTLTEAGAGLAANASHWSLGLLPTALGLQGCDHAGLLRSVLGFKPVSSCLCNKFCYPGTIFPAPRFFLVPLSGHLFTRDRVGPILEKAFVILSWWLGWLHTATLSSLRSFLNHSGLKTWQTQVLGHWTRKAFQS